MALQPPSPAEPSRLFFGRCELRVDSRELWVAGIRKPIRRRVFDLMVCLIRQRPAAVRHDELKRAVWLREDCSQTVLARAIMEARQACEDADDAPRFFVSVHGVGYRFAGDIRTEEASALAQASRETQADSAMDELRARVHQAQHAWAEQRLDEAGRIAEDAVTKSQVLGAQPERVRALLVGASIAIARNQMPEAARLASHALQIAATEGHAPLVAQARVATGRVHVLAGDRATGIRHLREAMDIFTEHGPPEELTRCMEELARALHDQGELEAALEVCRRRVAASARCDGHRSSAHDRLRELALLTALGDHLEVAGDRQGAHARFEDGLACGRSLLRDLDIHGHEIDRLRCQDGLSVLLERLGRLDEARAMAEACDAQRLRLPAGVAWPDADQWHRFRLQRARLAAHQGDVQTLLKALDEVLSAASMDPPSLAKSELYRLGADLASRHGAHEHAARWLHKQCEVLVRIQIDRGAALAAILAAELNADALQRELERARREADDVRVENAELRRRVQQLEGAIALSPQTGLASGDQILGRLASTHERACLRGLPLCIGLLQWAGTGDARDDPWHGTLVPHLREAAEALAAHPDVAAPAYDLGGGRIAFQVLDAGLARARAVCTEIAERLSHPGPWLQPGTAVGRWRCAAADAVQFPSLRACLDSMTPPPVDEPPARLLTGNRS